MKLDDFESLFRSSVKARFHLDSPRMESVVLLTDLPADQAESLESTARRFLSASLAVDKLAWRTTCEGEFGRVREMVSLLDKERPDLVISYRHLLGRDKDLLHSLGSFIDTVTQVTEFPVLLLPPLGHSNFEQRMARLETVLVATDHIIGDERLINWGLFMCPEHGTVVLAHVEDDTTFQRYMDIIAMIPDANTETTVERIKKKLLGRPADYIGSIAEALESAHIDEKVVPIVTMGRALSDYQRIVEEHNVDLIVLNTKDESQLAMHGMAYAISVELHDRPLLLL
ncbi:MAG: universal stress protein [Proteobacteria bacterium]|nr:universal stress protein [Pseudomonadota bacterium]